MNLDRHKFPKNVLDRSAVNSVNDLVLEENKGRSLLRQDFIDTCKLFIDTQDYQEIAETSGTSFTTVNALLARRVRVTDRNINAVTGIFTMLHKRMNQYQYIINKLKTKQNEKPQEQPAAEKKNRTHQEILDSLSTGVYVLHGIIERAD